MRSLIGYPQKISWKKVPYRLQITMSRNLFRMWVESIHFSDYQLFSVYLGSVQWKYGFLGTPRGALTWDLLVA